MQRLSWLLLSLPAVRAGEEIFLSGTHRIPRRSNLPLSEFFELYAETQTPVIIEDYADCFSGMSVANMVNLCGDKTATLSVKTNESKRNWAGLGQAAAEVSLGDLLQNRVDMEADVVGVFDVPLISMCSALLRDFFTVPKYVAQDFLQRVPQSEPLHYRDSWPSLFVGRNGSYGGLHTDVFGSAFWQYVIEGDKEWHIIDATIGADLFAPPDPPGRKERGGLRHYHDVVRAGELLLIPGNTQHQVRNLGRTIALAGNYVSRGSLGSMAAELEASDGTARYYAQVKRTISRPGFNTTIDLELGDLPWEDFKDQAERFPSPDALWSQRQLPQTMNVASNISYEVRGAGTAAANGLYAYAGFEDSGHEYALGEMRPETHSTGSRFLLFRVGSSDWWNIGQHVWSQEGGQEYRVHYASRKDATDENGPEHPPPANAIWANEKPGKWFGAEPPPTVVPLTTGAGSSDHGHCADDVEKDLQA